MPHFPITVRYFALLQYSYVIKKKKRRSNSFELMWHAVIKLLSLFLIWSLSDYTRAKISVLRELKIERCLMNVFLYKNEQNIHKNKS